MELNVTRFFVEAAPMDYSASVAEIGNDAGPATWRAAMDDSAEYALLDGDEQREAFREFVRSSGGWTAEEINAWTDQELNALCIQWVAGDIRECGLDVADPDWASYEEDANAGHVPGRLFRAEDGTVWFSLD